jgi:ABC-type phosphate/phosphonate transport system substrate-binding protein
MANLAKYDKHGDFTRVVHRTRTLPNQALSAGPRVTRDQQLKIAAALVAPDAATATAKLRAAYGSEKGFTRAAPAEYAGLDAYLKDVWGYAR